MYGYGIWSKLSNANAALTSRLQHYVTKTIKGFQPQTISAMCESMLRLPSPIAEVDHRKLLCLGELMSMPNNILPKQLFNICLQIYDIDSPQVEQLLIPNIHNIIVKYTLDPNREAYRCNGALPSKCSWKQITRHAILQNQLAKLDKKI